MVIIMHFTVDGIQATSSKWLVSYPTLGKEQSCDVNPELSDSKAHILFHYIKLFQ